MSRMSRWRRGDGALRFSADDDFLRLGAAATVMYCLS